MIEMRSQMFGVIAWIALGIVLALVVRVALLVKDPDGILVTVLIGIAGSLLGGFLSVALGWVEFGERTAVLAALAGAVVMLGLKVLSVRYESRTH